MSYFQISMAIEISKLKLHKTKARKEYTFND